MGGSDDIFMPLKVWTEWMLESLWTAPSNIHKDGGREGGRRREGRGAGQKLFDCFNASLRRGKRETERRRIRRKKERKRDDSHSFFSFLGNLRFDSGN